MRELSNIENEVKDIQAQIASIDEKLSTAEKGLDAEKRGYSEAILKNAGPDTLAKHRDSVTSCIAEHEALAGAKVLLSDDLAKAENEKAIVSLYQGDGTRHNTEMGNVEAAATTLNTKLPALQTLVREISTAIKKIVSGTEKASSSLKFISDNLDPGLSLESFLNGDMEPADGEDRTGLLDNIGEDLRDSISSLVVPENIPLGELEGLIESMIRWRALVSSFQEGSALIENRKRLFAPVGKKPSTQRITVPKIPHSKTEPEIKRPPVPKFSRNKVVEDHNRRALA